MVPRPRRATIRSGSFRAFARDEKSAGTFDEDYGILGGQLLVRSLNLAEVDGLAFEFCCDARRQRVAQVDGVDHVERLFVIHDRRVDFRVVASAWAAGDGFEGGG
jgi:hypothetical protein